MRRLPLLRFGLQMRGSWKSFVGDRLLEFTAVLAVPIVMLPASAFVFFRVAFGNASSGI